MVNRQLTLHKLGKSERLQQLCAGALDVADQSRLGELVVGDGFRPVARDDPGDRIEPCRVDQESRVDGRRIGPQQGQDRCRATIDPNRRRFVTASIAQEVAGVTARVLPQVLTARASGPWRRGSMRRTARAS